jgi:cation transport regulator ChaB
MPYSSINEIPDYVKKKTKNSKKRRQWMQVFNSVYRQTRSEARAFAAANAVMSRKKEYTKEEVNSIIKDYINCNRKGKFIEEDEI